MRLREIATNLDLKPASDVNADAEVTSGYVSDLLSDVLAKGKNGTLWVTNQKHKNVIGVAVMLDLAGVIIAGGLEPDEDTVSKARDEKVALYTITSSAFDLTGKLYELGIRSC